MPAGYEIQGRESKQKIKFWRALAIGTLIVTWSMILVSVLG